jgi:hypothetical protein
MSRRTKAILLLVALYIIMVVSCFIMQGCGTPPASYPAQTATPVQMLTQIVYKANWLVTVGFLTCFAAVYTFFNGNGSKAIPLFGAGIFLIAGVSVYAALTQALVAWIPWFTIGVPILGVIAFGLWAYSHYHRTKALENTETRLEWINNMVDKNKDGKVDVVDLKLALGA